jgi:hypothetical protein
VKTTDFDLNNLSSFIKCVEQKELRNKKERFEN